jgi:type I restriction enzyme, R subunit
MPPSATESTFEEATLQRLQALGYRYLHGGTIDRPLQSVVLEDSLRAYLHRRYRHLPAAAIEQAVQRVSAPEGLTLDRRNLDFARLLREGYTVRYESQGEDQFEHIHYADFEHPTLNEFLAVNQFTIDGHNTRRPDILIFLNGLPIVLFELKSPWDEYVDVAGAFNQVGHYVVDIPRLFEFNTFCVVSDGNTTLHGTHEGSIEWYAPWKSIDGETVEANTTGSMKTLIEGLFPKERLLDYVRNFVVHEVVNEKITKKAAKYHQFFAVRLAAAKAVASMRSEADKRVGVIWHTQGSGKSLSMIFLTGILRRWPGLNPTILVQVDRNDLDNQLYQNFVAAQELVGSVHQADSIDALRSLLATEGGEVICTTIEKFNTREGEQRHPILNAASNLLVMADEAHRTQYNLLTGFAYHLRQALPNASFIGFTGTPVDKEDANTIQLFGDTIHTYDMKQAKEDNAVVGLFYEARHIPLDLANEEIDRDLEEIADEIGAAMEEGLPAERIELAKAKWSALEQAAGTPQRLAELAGDLVAHFNQRQTALAGKAMAVCMSRRNAVGLYNALTALPDCPRVKVVMTGNLSADPKEWNEAGHITTKKQRETIKGHFVDPDDPLKIVIVCDMWLTGFDAPCANTLYVDKPMRGHNLMQAIARVNRIFRDKPAGVIVDYIGIADQLKEATRKYTSGGGRGELAEDLLREAVGYFEHQLECTRAYLPAGQPYARWRELSAMALEDLTHLCYGTLTGDEKTLDDFLADEHRLSKAYSLVSHLPRCVPHREEVAFYQMLRKQLRKLKPTVRKGLEDLDRAVRELVDESVSAQPAVDIFAVSGLGKPDISILDDAFLAGFRKQKTPDLQALLLEKLMRDELELRRRGNLVQYRNFREMLDETITRYNNRAIQAADVVKVLVEIRQAQVQNDQRKQELGLSDEELAFYDVIREGAPQGIPTDNEWIASLVRDVVQSVRGNVKVDWTRSHRRDVHAGVESAVKMVLRRRKIQGEQFRFLLHRLMKQAEATYEEWPLAA